MYVKNKRGNVITVNKPKKGKKNKKLTRVHADKYANKKGQLKLKNNSNRNNPNQNKPDNIE